MNRSKDEVALPQQPLCGNEGAMHVCRHFIVGACFIDLVPVVRVRHEIRILLPIMSLGQFFARNLRNVLLLSAARRNALLAGTDYADG